MTARSKRSIRIAVRPARAVLAVALVLAACGQAPPELQTFSPTPGTETEATETEATETGGSESEAPGAVVLTFDLDDGFVHPEPRLAVMGRSTPSATVRLDGQPGGVLVGDDGRWTLVVDLAEGDNALRFIASLAGRTDTTRMLTVVHDPSASDPPFSP